MADTAIFKKSKGRASRTRVGTPSTDADDAADVSASAVAAKVRKQQRERIKPKAKLSFGADEDGDEDMGEVKKKFSKKLNLGVNVSSSLMTEMIEQAQTPSQSSGVVYSKEYLSELRAGTKSALSREQSPRPTQDVDLVFDESEMAGAIIVDQDTPIDVVPEIPSAASVAAAKDRRERMRQGISEQKEEDFISLDVMRKADAYQGPHPESRLMREDDDLGEGDDDFSEFTSAKERIALGKRAKKKEAASKRTAMKEMIEDAEEEDEETQEWENAQLRRITRQESEAPEAAPKREYRPAPIPPPTTLPSLDTAMHRLTESMSQLVSSHSSNTASISKLAEERLALETKEKHMREMVVSAENKRSWFSGFRDWVETVAAFLDEKYPALEKLEEEHLSLVKERRDMVDKRRQRDNMDDFCIIFGEIGNMTTPVEPQLDELGRELPNENDSLSRRVRRTERSARHQKHVTQEEEGYSTDGSLIDADEVDFKAAISSLYSKAKGILGDVRSDEFRDPRKGLARWFGDWRERYPESYEGAFGGLGMLSAWEFWARLEILGWDPISGPRPFDGFEWYGALHNYSRPNSSGSDDMEDEGENLGPEGDLAPAMVSTIVPRICKVIENGAFDPYSLRHVRSVIELSEQIEIYATKEKIDYLLKTVMTQFRQAIGESLEMLQPYLDIGNNMRFDPEAIPARKRILTKQYKLLTVLCRWRKHTGEKFGMNELITRLVQMCIRPVAQGAWEVGGQEIMQKVTGILPPELHSSILASGH